MAQVAATEFTRNFGRYRELAQREAIAVTSHDRITGYFVSAHEYERVQAIAATNRVALSIYELDDDTVEAIANARMDPRHDHLNSLMD
jgi:PHD/YefM family antitoxin component YafN of YafNO toxin-antitoxin module